MKRFIKVEEAISLLPDKEDIHTFYQMGNTLVGADWNRSDVIRKLRESDKIEIAGEGARSMGHGLAVYKDDAKWQSDIWFIETDEEKLNKFDSLEDTCSKCRYFHRLKHNYRRSVGFEDSYCCTMWLYDDSKSKKDIVEPWVQEVEPTDRCEMFSPKEKDHE